MFFSSLCESYVIVFISTLIDKNYFENIILIISKHKYAYVLDDTDSTITTMWKNRIHKKQ